MTPFRFSHYCMGWVFLGISACFVVVPLLTGNDITQFFTLALAAMPWPIVGKYLFGETGYTMMLWPGLVLNAVFVFFLGYVVSRFRIMWVLFRSPYSKLGWQFLGIYMLCIVLWLVATAFFPQLGDSLITEIEIWLLSWRGLFVGVLVFLLGYFLSYSKGRSNAVEP